MRRRRPGPPRTASSGRTPAGSLPLAQHLGPGQGLPAPDRARARRGLGEVDWSQIEVGLAAAVYHDAALVRMFNTGDAYAAMAQDFFRDRLSVADRRLPGIEFKARYPDLRDRMKACTLGIIYGVTPHGLARQLDTSVAAAAALQERFMAHVPDPRAGRLREAAAFGAIRGYAATVSGLRRHAPGAGPPSNWERNWLTNHPVQGSAAVVFKAAGNRLDRLYRQHDAWLVVPLHDAFVFEAPLGAGGRGPPDRVGHVRGRAGVLPRARPARRGQPRPAWLLEQEGARMPSSAGWRTRPTRSEALCARRPEGEYDRTKTYIAVKM